MEKKKIYAAVGILSAGIMAGVGLHIYDSNIDHLNEYCPLNNVFGVEHQINKINNMYDNYGLNAYYAEESTKKVSVEPQIMHLSDGTKQYVLPDGYVLEDGKGVKYITSPEKIVITQDVEVYPEGESIHFTNEIPVPSRKK